MKAASALFRVTLDAKAQRNNSRAMRAAIVSLISLVIGTGVVLYGKDVA
jgi:hypothetical protein